MFISFTAEGNFGQAIAKTFDGEHPCNLCKFVQHGKGTEKNSPAKEIAKKKLDPIIAQSPTIKVEPASVEPHPPVDFSYVTRVHPPLPEPPDLA